MMKPNFSRRLILLAVVCCLALVGALAILTGAKATSAGVSAVTIGLVTDSPTLMDEGFNQMSYEGLQRAESELGVVGTVYISTDSADILANMEQCALDGNALCFGVGWLTYEAISTTAPLYTQTHFAILDVTFEDYPDNLRGISFASEEAGYLAGTLAGWMTVSDVLGVVGGMEIPTVDAFIDGYERGAECANPDVTTIITYTNDFNNPELGSQVALQLLAQDADVIFGVAGPTGAGAIVSATQAGAWGIGVDVDQYLTVFQGGLISGSEYLLTSAMKKVDNAVFLTISDEVDGNFTPGTVIYDLASDGVGLAPFHETDPAIPADAKTAIETARLGLIAGTINPYGPCEVFTDHVGLVTDSPNLMDGSINQMSYEGLLRAESELGILGTVYTSTDTADIQTKLEQCALDGNGLCISVGYQTMGAISVTAPMFSQTHFAILDSAFDTYPDNLRGITFSSEEAAYLAGTLAGYMTESDILGIIGGMQIPPVDAFIDGYAQGALCANPQVTTLITYTNDFLNPELGSQYALDMLAQDADIIFAPAGPTGAGAIISATQAGAWAVGVDFDQYFTDFMSGTITGSEYLLTSAIKKFDNAVYHTIADQIDELFTPGTVIYDLVSNGVGLAPFHEADAAIPADAKAAVEDARLGLIDGSIDPYGPCPVAEYKVFLPLGSKNFSP